MEILAYADFLRRAERLGITRHALLAAVARIERGSIDAQLGSGLIKQRVEAQGRGKSGGARAVLFLKREQHVIFIHVYAKSRQTDLTPKELEVFRITAKNLAALGAEDIQSLLLTREWSRIE
ncbi:type II toxin-antitoxin system RelE/ParE family toxin [Nostoc sp. NIES-2111]